MEILLTLAYVFLVRLVFFEYRWLPWNMATGILVYGLYAAAALTGPLVPPTSATIMPWGELTSTIQSPMFVGRA